MAATMEKPTVTDRDVRDAVGAVLAAARKRIDASQREVVEMYNQQAPDDTISPASYSHWETGRSLPEPHRWPDIEHVMGLERGEIAQIVQRVEPEPDGDSRELRRLVADLERLDQDQRRFVADVVRSMRKRWSVVEE